MRTKKPTKQSRAEAAYEKETQDSYARLRRTLGRLVKEKPGDGTGAYDYHPRVTFRMFCILMRIDLAMVGTPDYMGIAYFWAEEYKHSLRGCTPRERKDAHDRLLAAGLPLDGVSDQHREIISSAARRYIKRENAANAAWMKGTTR
jgi:hypothetical protein